MCEKVFFGIVAVPDGNAAYIHCMSLQLLPREYTVVNILTIYGDNRNCESD